MNESARFRFSIHNFTTHWKRWIVVPMKIENGSYRTYLKLSNRNTLGKKNNSVAIQFFIIPRQLQSPVSAGNSNWFHRVRSDLLVIPETIVEHNKFHQAWMMPWRNLHVSIETETLLPSSVVQKENQTRQAE